MLTAVRNPHVRTGLSWSRYFHHSRCLPKEYITSPIFYVNASPHLGHAYTMLLCDARHRWEKLKQDSTSYFTTGTDEHGLKIQAVAEAKGYSNPQVLVDEVSQNFKLLAQQLDVKYDRFIRTTDPDHVETVKRVWNIIYDKGLIYKGTHGGWYSISDETFVPETQIEEVNGKMISRETRNEVTYQEETNYFFKMSAFQEQLVDYLEENPTFVTPRSKYEELLRELKTTKLEDLSISRPSSRLSWSIEVPNDPSQKIYVWFDALTNYITAADFTNKFVLQENGTFDTSKSRWPATHVIGKDIIKFHCIYWPTFLMALGIQLPKQVVVHSHWLSDGFKMSKSLGNVVDPILTLEYYGQDALRFFLLEHSNIENDCNFSEIAFSNTRDTIISKYANLVTRCGGAKFDIETSVLLFEKYLDIESVITSLAKNPAKINDILACRANLIGKLNSLAATMDDKVAQFDYMRAIQDWWATIESANLLFQTAEPWLYTKGDLLQNYYVFLAAETCRISSILISPIVPSLAETILDRLNVSPEKRTFENALIGADSTYGRDANSKKHKVPLARIPMRE